MIVSRTYTFDSAHHLPGHNGKCAHLHGHTYKLEVECQGLPKPVGPSDGGMVIDYNDIDRAVRPLVAALDHQNLNSVLEDVVERTTAELLSLYILGQLRPMLPNVVAVTLWETTNSKVRADLDDLRRVAVRR